ncbi:hypothetical protein HYD98_00955 [Mycoplasmopsis bovis]|nr:hypothetical protein [Mycoplasmopsis bovis]QQH29180.1 hypothetical protein HYD98_00955 [Mycoplasmopsis bovis]
MAFVLKYNSLPVNSEIALLKKDWKIYRFNNDNNKPTNTLIIGEKTWCS